ncbi:MAG: YncE family protein [Desulfitobacterium hafniense]|nr:YncE family protein [Desulfitobacterium hafniense]
MLFETHAWVTLDNAVAIYNVYSDELIATIPVGVSPFFPKRTPDGTKVLVPNFGSNTVSILCTAANRVLATIPVGIAPTAVAVDPTSTTAYVTNSGSGTVSVISIPTESVVGTISVGTSPVDAFVSRNGSRVYVSNSGSNSISVINPTTNSVVATIPVGTAPNGLITSLDNTKLYVVNNGSNNVSVIDTATNTVITTIPVGTSPQKIAANPVTPFLYVTNNGSNTVSVIATATNTVVATVGVGIGPRGVDVTGDGTQVWVANEGDSSISIINASTNTIQAALPTAFPPRGVTVGRVGSALSPGEPIDLTDPYQLEEVSESVCIIVEKVFASCQQRECFPAFTIQLPTGGVPPFTFVSMTFANGVIVPGSIIITPIPSRPNFSRVQFTVQIPFTLILRDSTGALFTITGNLPDIDKDIVLFFPPTRPEFDLSLRIETRTELLTSPLFTATSVEVAVGSFVVTKVTGLVQLLVPAFGYCPEPPVCEEFPSGPSNPCINFFDTTLTPFPTDFFPRQLDEC